MTMTFDYGMTTVRDLQVRQSTRGRSGKLTIKKLKVDGRVVAPTPRFWKSFFIRFGISENVFRYFEPEEVFTRISERAADDAVRYCIESGPKQKDRLLAVTNANRSIIRYGEVCDIVDRYQVSDHQYDAGIVTSTHAPRSGEQPFTIGGDRFEHRFVMETPIDGFGHPRIFLSFLRLVCTNGMIGYGRAFRSDVSLGKDVAHCISRALESFDNDEGYAALHQRFDSAQKSWASVRECTTLQKLMVNLSDGQNITADNWSRDFHRMTGNLHTLYGLANLDAISQKRQRVLPARCRVYDLLNFASELATHRASAAARTSLQAFIGNLISDEYDMEGTAENVTDFADFFIKDSEPGPATSMN